MKYADDIEADELLAAAVLHWKRIQNEVRNGRPWVGISASDCPLCARYDDCEGCPVAEHMGMSGCQDTPFYDVYNARRRVLDQLTDYAQGERAMPLVGMDKLDRAVQAELRFLEELLAARTADDNKENEHGDTKVGPA